MARFFQFKATNFLTSAVGLGERLIRGGGYGLFLRSANLVDGYLCNVGFGGHTFGDSRGSGCLGDDWKMGFWYAADKGWKGHTFVLVKVGQIWFLKVSMVLVSHNTCCCNWTRTL